MASRVQEVMKTRHKLVICPLYPLNALNVVNHIGAHMLRLSNKKYVHFAKCMYAVECEF